MQSWVAYKSFHLYDVEFGLCFSVRNVVSHPSRCELTMWGSMLWFEQWLVWWRWLIPSRDVVLESAKVQILWVNTPGQHVPPRVRYGMTCLLIRNAILCVLLSWVGIGNTLRVTLYDILCEMPKPHGARGAFAGESLALQAGPLMENSWQCMTYSCSRPL
jgi:hypothetical protein